MKTSSRRLSWIRQRSRSRSPRTRRDVTSGKCFKCGKLDHIARDCPELVQAAAAALAASLWSNPLVQAVAPQYYPQTPQNFKSVPATVPQPPVSTPAPAPSTTSAGTLMQQRREFSAVPGVPAAPRANSPGRRPYCTCCNYFGHTAEQCTRRSTSPGRGTAPRGHMANYVLLCQATICPILILRRL